MAYIQSFRRYETKYLLTEAQCEAFLAAASELLVPDKYGDYTICNLYLDTEDFYFIEHSLDKPEYKEKLRLRSYGNVEAEDKVFLEIKKKSRGIVYKRRITLPLHEAMDYLLRGIPPETLHDWSARQIFSEIDYLMQKYKPLPRVYLAYDRLAFTMRGYPEIRLTLDGNIRSRFDDLTLSHDEGISLLDTGTPNYRLMEIKSDGAIPIPLTKILSQLKIYPVSFSKYGRIYTNYRKALVTNE